jgi:hypothetical protein
VFNGLINFQRVGTYGGKLARPVIFVPVLLALPCRLDPDLGTLQTGDRKGRDTVSYQDRTQRAMKKTHERKHQGTTGMRVNRNHIRNETNPSASIIVSVKTNRSIYTEHRSNGNMIGLGDMQHALGLYSINAQVGAICDTGKRRKVEVELHGKSQEIRDRSNQITTRTTLMKRTHQTN